MINLDRILVSGGAGYIGSVLVRMLLRAGQPVRVMDNLRFGGETLVELFNDHNFDFQKGDVRNEEDLRRALDGVKAVVHLAAIVGDPACAKEPQLARATNFLATRRFYELANGLGVKKFVYASTCSNYGKMKEGGAYVDEDSELSPVSLYAETKVESERYLLSQPKGNTCKPTCLRFSTVYGLSPRIRFDLTVNEFTKEVALGRELVIFGEQFWRPYCHVSDLARAVMAVLEALGSKVAFEVFNVGDTAENYQKRMLADEILKLIPDGKVKYVHKDEDPRDYRVCFRKISEKLEFRITKRVPDGIEQIIRVIRGGMLSDPDDPKYKNV
jgi:nucleoside-diphosphate-sugar epimerase